MDELELARFRIYALQDGAIRAQALVFCLRLGLFDRLNEEPLALGEVAREFGLSPRVLPALFSFLSANGLVRRDAGGRFANTEASSAFLVRQSPRYIGGRGLLFGGFYEAIRNLPEALATGMPWTPAGQHDMFAGFGPDEQRWFAEGMFSNAVHGGMQLVGQLDFSAARRLLDVGGNAGGYSIAILRAYSHLKATIFDLEGTRKLAAERIAENGMAQRISFAAGSFFQDELPRGHDIALLASVLHDWGDDDCREILARCYRALDAGAMLVVTEPMLADDATGPDHPAASGLTMALLGGENRTRSRIRAMLTAAGFDNCWVSGLGPQNSTVTARKP